MPKINPHIFRAYDIRGIAETNGTADTNNTANTPDLTEETVYLIGKGTATHLIRNYNSKHMAVGRDVRLSSPSLQKAFIKGCLECGLDVTDIGLSPSPMIYFVTCAHQYPELVKFDCATNITASHNPKEYNGVKTVALNAHSICGDELQKILQLIETENFEIPGAPTAKRSTQGTLYQANIWPIYRDELASKLHTENKLLPQVKSRPGTEESRPLKIVIDSGNGVAGPFAPELLRQIGAEVIELYCEPDGTFPHHEANPEELENMTDLIKKVLAEKADLGIGFDGDADRIGIIDEKGNHYSSDYLLLLLAKDYLARNQKITPTTPTTPQTDKPKIVFDVKVSQAIINKMASLGAEPTMSKTGHSFIEKRMKEVQAPLAGEVSGHLFFAENYYGFDDAFLAAIKILEILANENLQTDHPFSALFNDLPKTYMTPEFKAHCPDDKKFEIVKSLVTHFTALYDCITIDGVRVKFDSTSWGAVRASNTSPNLTLRFEADTEEKLAEIQKIMVDELKKYPEVNLDWYKI